MIVLVGVKDLSNKRLVSMHKFCVYIYIILPIVFICILGGGLCTNDFHDADYLGRADCCANFKLFNQ
jgi:hypothetical protein